MPEVLTAHAAYKKADEDALLMRFRARARLGREVDRQHKERGSTLESIAEELGVVANQVRRYRDAYRAWLKEYGEESLDQDD